MPYELYLLIGLAGFSVAILAWAFGISLPRLGKPSYQDLLDEKARLNAAVTHWKYADGSLVPQHKRQQMFKDLHRLSYKIRTHPDNPGNAQEQSEPAVDA